MAKRKSLRAKITRAMIAVVIGMLLCVGVIVAVSMKDVSQTLIESNREIGRTSSNRSLVTINTITRNRLQQLAGDKADIADQMFVEFEQAVRVTATAAERIYADPSAYAMRTVPLPDASKDGQLSIQILYAPETDPQDTKIVRELRLLGNLQDTLLAINESFPSMASNYFATETGFIIVADYISDRKFDADGNILPLEARIRPWYAGAGLSGASYFTPVVKDVHTGRPAIMCGIPVYRKGELMGVAGAGMYLDDVEELVTNFDLGMLGDACILNRSGQVVFSTDKEGAFAAGDGTTDLRRSDNEALAALVKRAVSGESGVALVKVDGVQSYVAYAPMKTVGWSFFVLLSQEEIEAPTQALRTNLDDMTNEAVRDAYHRINRTLALLLAVFVATVVAALAISVALSRHIVRPIKRLTEAVSGVEGDRLDFQWEENTGDETQLLADSFQSLTGRMKAYIADIQAITAERERIGTELAIATQIQASMLPHQFPPFPERHEFDLYAVMDPAKEVGGDFYDFFLIDDDHLCLVIADVSGKGVPAALFMMSSKIILADNAMMGKSPAEILAATNAAICQNNQEQMFVTVWLGILEISTGRLVAANAGHEYPALKKPGGAFELVKDRHGFIVGGMDGARYRDYEWQLEPGTKLFIYTDGVPEATSAAEELFGTERMLAALNADPDAAPGDVLSNVRRAVDAFVGDAPQFDDLTMLCLEYRGGTAKT